MKKFKRVGAIILTVMMLLGLNLTGVLAVTDASGRDLDADVSLTIYKYEKPYFEDVDNDGLEQTVPTDAVSIADVVFKIELVTLKEGATAGSTDLADYVAVTGDDAFSTTGMTDSTGKVVFSTIDADSSTDDSDIISTAIDVLPGQGIYKVTETSGPDSTSVTFIVSLPMTNPDTESSDKWLYDVYAYPKNDVLGLSITKEYVGEENDGNILTWEISAPIPSDIGSVDEDVVSVGSSSLVITDALDTRLTYVTGTITCTDKSGAPIDLYFDDETEDDDYTLSVTDSTDSDDNAIQVLTITFTEAGLKKLAAAFEAEVEEGEDASTPAITFTFDTKTGNDTGDTSFLGTIENTAVLSYTNKSGYVYGTAEGEAETDLYGIKINKINVTNENLSGAKFKIYTSAADATANTNALKNPNGTYDWEVTSANGYAYIYGLVEGTYYLVETQAPTGYNLLTTPVTVVIDPDAEDDSIVEYVVSVTITNSKGFELPITGGTGTLIFTLAGLVLIGAAVVFLVLSKKKKARNNANA